MDVKLTSLEVKRNCTLGFLTMFRRILYDSRLHSGAKLTAFAIMDRPLVSELVNAVIARKLETSESMISQYKKELKEQGYL